MGIFENMWIIQGIGVIGLLFVIISFLSPTRHLILRRQIVGAFFFIIHFLLLSAPTGAAMNAVIILRNWVFDHKYHPTSVWAKSKFWPYIFSALALALLSVAWQGWISLLPVAGIIIGTFGRWFKSPAKIRIYILLSVFAWLVFNIAVGSYPGMISDTLVIISLIAGIYRYDRNLRIQH